MPFWKQMPLMGMQGPSQLTDVIGVGGPTRICCTPSGDTLPTSATGAFPAVWNVHCASAL